jgi:CheY-like chemotaxis protein
LPTLNSSLHGADWNRVDGSRGVDILLVEDNPDHAHFTLKALAGDNGVQQVYWVKDGQEALDFLYRRDRWADPATSPRPGLILLDIHLPKIDGHAVLKQVKGDENLRSIPVVMLTTSDRQDEVAATYKVGANSFVTKPVKFTHFTEQIRIVERYWTRTNRLPDDPAPAPTMPPRPAASAPPHVLVIDGHEASREALERMVTGAGMQVTAVGSVQQALTAAESAVFDVVVTEVALGAGVQDGVWLLNRLYERSPEVPVVAISRLDERAHELVGMGFASVLFRPIVAPDDFITLVRSVIRPR